MRTESEKRCSARFFRYLYPLFVSSCRTVFTFKKIPYIPLKSGRKALDKEFFECDEYIKSEENQIFPAEKYRVNETENGAAETFFAPETSAAEPSSANTDASGLSLGDAEELVQSASVSATASASASAPVSLSASATASVGATGVFAGIAAVCVAAAVGIVPVTGLTQNTAEEPPISTQEPADAGTLNFSNYRVDYYPDEDSAAVFSDITFYFEGALPDGFSCELSDSLTGRSVPVNGNTVAFEKIEKGEREFLLTILNGDEIAETRTLNVADYYINATGTEFNYAYKVTYNSDDTCNLYAYLTTDYDGDFVTYINLYSPSGSALDGYETATDGALSRILHIEEEKYTAEFVSYYVKDNNYYSYCSSEEIVIDNEALPWQANIHNDSLTLTFGNEIRGDVKVQVIHDDLTRDEFTVPAKEFTDNSCALSLSKISRTPTVEILVDSVLYNFDPMGYITVFNGEEFRQFSESVTVEAVVSSYVNLTRCEIFNASYNIDYGDTIHAPVYLYFDGYLNEGDTYSVKVIDRDGGEVDSATNLTLSGKPVIFEYLSIDTEYTFLFYLTANGDETLSGTVTETLSVPEYSDLPPLFCLTPNPGDVMVTYNDDGTSNVYLYMGVRDIKEKLEQESTPGDAPAAEYDMYYKIYLVSVASEDGSAFCEYAGKDDVAVFRNVPAGTYALKYGVLVNENGTCYSVYDMQWPSGTIVAGLDENGYYPESCGNVSYDSSTGELTVSVSGKVVSDLHINVITDDGQSISITVPVGDISAGYGSSVCTVDLSAYSLTSFTAVIEGEAIFQYGNGDSVKNEVNVAGDESCPFRIKSEI